MYRVMLLMMQSAAETPPAPPLDFVAVPRCPTDTGGDDVVICGRRDPDRYRLKPLPPRFERDADHLPTAEVPLGGGTLAATTQQATIGGVPSNRIMLGWKLKF